MMREIAMLILAIVVAGSMAFILIRFLRQLRRIEIDMWGQKARGVEEARAAKASDRAAKAAEEKKHASEGH